MGQLKRPVLALGPLNDLFGALHDLHQQAGSPSLEVIGARVNRSRSVVYRLFTEARLPDPVCLREIVEELARRAKLDLKHESGSFHQLWMTAREPALDLSPAPPDRIRQRIRIQDVLIEQISILDDDWHDTRTDAHNIIRHVIPTRKTTPIEIAYASAEYREWSPQGDRSWQLITKHRAGEILDGKGSILTLTELNTICEALKLEHSEFEKLRQICLYGELIAAELARKTAELDTLISRRPDRVSELSVN